jgi:hypothetical protein
MDVRDPVALRRALGLLLAGMLLVFVDLRINGFDLLPDMAGWVLAVVTLGRCRDAHHDDAYASRMTAAWVLAWICAVFAVLDFADVRVAPHVYGLVAAAQPVVTAFAFARLAAVAGPAALRRSWDTSIVLLLAGVVVALFALALRDNGFGAVAAVVSVVAAVYYLVSIARTRTALSTPADAR